MVFEMRDNAVGIVKLSQGRTTMRDATLRRSFTFPFQPLTSLYQIFALLSLLPFFNNMAIKLIHSTRNNQFTLYEFAPLLTAQEQVLRIMKIILP